MAAKREAALSITMPPALEMYHSDFFCPQDGEGETRKSKKTGNAAGRIRKKIMHLPSDSARPCPAIYPGTGVIQGR
jgi:hypothetical protein